MSMKYCPTHDLNVNTDYDAEHFSDNGSCIDAECAFEYDTTDLVLASGYTMTATKVWCSTHESANCRLPEREEV